MDFKFYIKKFRMKIYKYIIIQIKCIDSKYNKKEK